MRKFEYEAKKQMLGLALKDFGVPDCLLGDGMATAQLAYADR